MTGRYVKLSVQVLELTFCVITEELATSDGVSGVKLEKLGSRTLKELPKYTMASRRIFDDRLCRANGGA